MKTKLKLISKAEVDKYRKRIGAKGHFSEHYSAVRTHINAIIELPVGKTYKVSFEDWFLKSSPAHYLSVYFHQTHSNLGIRIKPVQKMDSGYCIITRLK